MSKITSWEIGINNVQKMGNLFLYKEPVWLAIVGWLIHNIIGRTCCSCGFHYLTIPKWICIYDKEEKKWFPWQDCHMDFGDWFHYKIYMPLYTWHDSHPSRKQITIGFGYDKLKEYIYELDKDMFDEYEKISEEY